MVLQVRQGFALGVWALAGVGAWRRLRRGHGDMAFLVLAAAPFLLLFLRIYTFALPFMVTNRTATRSSYWHPTSREDTVDQPAELPGGPPDGFMTVLLGIGMSLALGIVVAQLMIYTHLWSPLLGWSGWSPWRRREPSSRPRSGWPRWRYPGAGIALGWLRWGTGPRPG